MNHPSLSEALARGRAAAAKLLAGVPLGGERVWPGQRNDLFLAHLSIYRFFARFCSGARVLDAGCGLGYGSELLAASGSRNVLGVDIDPRSVRFARRRYRRPNLEFRVGDCERLELANGSFDLVVSSNAMEHLERPERFLEAARRGLCPAGTVLVAVPPISGEQHLADNRANPHHLSNLTVGRWLDLFTDLGWQVAPYRHTHPRWRELDFASYRPSRLHEDGFLFEPTDRDALAREDTLTALFRLTPSTPSRGGP